LWSSGHEWFIFVEYFLCKSAFNFKTSKIIKKNEKKIKYAISEEGVERG
jgi:hypothetical protein